MTGGPPSRRLLLVHAHPDDETLMTGGTIAHYLAAGVDVAVVTFTLGEEGEVIGPQWAGLAADGGADQLGGFRIGELAAALAALSPDGSEPLAPRFLGGAGRWRDSGMAGSPASRNPRALVQAPLTDVVEALIGELRAFDPHVVITYDAAGTYGHPDHRRVHEACAAALARYTGETGRAVKVYESITAATALRAGLAAAADRVPAGWRLPGPGELPSYPDDEITAQIDVSAVRGRKVAALAAHATQVTVAPSATEYALSNNIVQPIGTVEYYRRVDAPGSGRETDLFEGVR
ncbi:N-acetyl-1-D-myo-inositol-2-amino-2-deoxy-alpha-D -glucopyranoside deacetylase [Gordonia defluvii]|jgi:N-acetyl-1-D-myo-inositol-2-amino-2-deoxy-alpha-D-glucopyranoside deacetylase|uniref:1D-myo-inositol 2-acetamido-2-deoxy-alpha-D-glucopyranoside deacetylase n=1 Tax=Gordonia defluvii TaxID=283718 RepID=A0ABP6LIF6_9ACTN|nr:N-acetyl-1-D-myo-inositol-2-amino-2-deoxy-alpha-D-glucopyranoside deacetylase [Gordonia sp. UBA5067]